VQDIFGFEQQGVSPVGIAHGRFYATGYRPACLQRFRTAGIELSDELFAST
jgi:pilus assembly protein CpaF